jgi:hypothetical protein
MNGEFNEIFGFVDLGIGALWFFILLFLANFKKSSIENAELRRYFMPMMYFKLFLGISFMLVYVFYYEGGDNTAFWQGGVKMNKLLFSNPSAYFADLLNFDATAQRDIYIYSYTGYPPGWIFKEYESWFVCKTVSLLSIITLRSYIATSLILTYFTAMASWRLFELVSRQNIISTKQAAIAILFIPSVGFWCTGITKDSLTFIALIYWIITLYSVFNGYKKLNLKSILLLLGSAFVLLNVRSFVFYVVLMATLFGLLAGFQKKVKKNFLLRFGYISSLIIGVVAALVISINLGVLETLNQSAFLEEAQIQSTDFERNQIYTGRKYDLGVSEYTVTGIIKVFPLAVLTAFYRPVIFEALSPVLILNGLESLILIWFTLKFFFQGSFIKKIGLILSNEILSFALFFSVFFGFVVGLTSILFGVLVRFRAPILPFLAIMLMAGTAIYAKNKLSKAENNQAEDNLSH